MYPIEIVPLLDADLKAGGPDIPDPDCSRCEVVRTQWGSHHDRINKRPTKGDTLPQEVHRQFTNLQ